MFASGSVDYTTGKISALNLEYNTGARESGLPGHVKMHALQTVGRDLGSVQLIV